MSKLRAQHGQFEGAGNKAAHTRRITQLGKTHDLLADAARHTASLERRLIGTGQHGHSENLDAVSGLGDSRRTHFRSAAEVDGAEVYPVIPRGTHSRGHRVRNVVQFQIEKNARAAGPAAMKSWRPTL